MASDEQWQCRQWRRGARVGWLLARRRNGGARPPPEAGEHGTREDSSTDLTDEVRRDDIYGGRAEIAGREDAVEGADEDAAG